MLAHCLSQDEIKEICVLAHGKHNDHLKEQLYQLTLDDDRRVAVNALWALTHFASSDHEWLYAKRHHLIDRCIVRPSFGCCSPFSFVSHLAKKTSVQTLWTIA